MDSPAYFIVSSVTDDILLPNRIHFTQYGRVNDRLLPPPVDHHAKKPNRVSIEEVEDAEDQEPPSLTHSWVQVRPGLSDCANLPLISVPAGRERCV